MSVINVIESAATLSAEELRAHAFNLLREAHELDMRAGLASEPVPEPVIIEDEGPCGYDEASWDTEASHYYLTAKAGNQIGFLVDHGSDDHPIEEARQLILDLVVILAAAEKLATRVEA